MESDLYLITEEGEAELILERPEPGYYDWLVKCGFIGRERADGMIELVTE